MPTRAGVSTRVDPPHGRQAALLPQSAAPAPMELASLAGAPVTSAASTDCGWAEQLQRQAAELGDRLQTRQRELDRREATLQAQIAQLESELRSARLVESELQHELIERQQLLTQREAELERALADLLHAENDQRAEARQQTATASHLNEAAKLSAEQWRRRLAELDRGEQQLKSQLADVAWRQQTLDAERQKLAEDAVKQQRQLKQQRDEARQRCDQTLLRLQQRQEEVERRGTAVQRLHQDTSAMYREMIELRIATEQIWARISGQLSTPQLTRELASWRKKLMDQYALASESLQQQQADHLALLQQLAAQATSMKQARDELRQWLGRRQNELIDESEKLLQRERELEQEHAAVRHLQQQWTDQRAGYEQEIRRLRRMID